MARPTGVATILALTLTALFIAAVSACGGDDEPSGPPMATLRFRETEFRITPDVTNVGRPGIYRLVVVNRGKQPHALAVDGNDIHAETKSIGPGETAQMTVDLELGTYAVSCPVANHEGEGMRARLLVSRFGP